MSETCFLSTDRGSQTVLGESHSKNPVSGQPNVSQALAYRGRRKSSGGHRPPPVTAKPPAGSQDLSIQPLWLGPCPTGQSERPRVPASRVTGKGPWSPCGRVSGDRVPAPVGVAGEGWVPAGSLSRKQLWEAGRGWGQRSPLQPTVPEAGVRTLLQTATAAVRPRPAPGPDSPRWSATAPFSTRSNRRPRQGGSR